MKFDFLIGFGCLAFLLEFFCVNEAIVSKFVRLVLERDFLFLFFLGK